MAKRFGRNQKRAMREAVSLAHARSERLQTQFADKLRVYDRQIDELKAEVTAARRARDTIRITVDSILDDREDEMHFSGRFDMARRERLYVGASISALDIRRQSEVERAAFLRHASHVMAEHALAQLLRHWRSR